MPITIKPVRREHRAIPPRPVLELARYVVADAHKAYAKAEQLRRQHVMETPFGTVTFVENTLMPPDQAGTAWLDSDGNLCGLLVKGIGTTDSNGLISTVDGDYGYGVRNGKRVYVKGGEVGDPLPTDSAE